MKEKTVPDYILALKVSSCWLFPEGGSVLCLPSGDMTGQALTFQLIPGRSTLLSGGTWPSRELLSLTPYGC